VGMRAFCWRRAILALERREGVLGEGCVRECSSCNVREERSAMLYWLWWWVVVGDLRWDL